MSEERKLPIVWKPIAGYEGIYEVSTMGEIRALVFSNGTVKNKTLSAPKIMAQKVVAGYKRICLSKDGGRNYISVSRIVLETFIGPCPRGCETSHLNGDAHDNRLENLAWETKATNDARKAVHGRMLSGDRMRAVLRKAREARSG